MLPEPVAAIQEVQPRWLIICLSHKGSYCLHLWICSCSYCLILSLLFHLYTLCSHHSLPSHGCYLSDLIAFETSWTVHRYTRHSNMQRVRVDCGLRIPVHLLNRLSTITLVPRTKLASMYSSFTFFSVDFLYLASCFSISWCFFLSSPSNFIFFFFVNKLDTNCPLKWKL